MSTRTIRPWLGLYLAVAASAQGPRNLASPSFEEVEFVYAPITGGWGATRGGNAELAVFVSGVTVLLQPGCDVTVLL